MEPFSNFRLLPTRYPSILFIQIILILKIYKRIKTTILARYVLLLILQHLIINCLFAQDSVFTNTGPRNSYHIQTYTVPPNVTRIKVKLWGAGGGGTPNGYIGGGGGYATDTLNVTPGQKLTITVGEGGPGYHLSGEKIISNRIGCGGRVEEGIAAASRGGNGGGRSAIEDEAGTELIVAGGGGGAGTAGFDHPRHGGYAGAGGGLEGTPGSYPGPDGYPGTQTEGGRGGDAEPSDPKKLIRVGKPGSKGCGGAGAPYPSPGAGGGGYYGGGSGSSKNEDNGIDRYLGSGGGGSSFIPPGGSTIPGNRNVPGNCDITIDPDYADSAGYGGASGNTSYPFTDGKNGRVVIHCLREQIMLIDPYPSMIDENGKLKTTLKTLDISKEVKGAVTDGISKILLYVEATKPVHFNSLGTSYDGTLSDLSGSTRGSEIIVTPENGKAVAVYETPDGWGEFFDYEPERTIKVAAYEEGDVDNPTIYKEIQLKKPPVILVHGMWSSPAAWTADGNQFYSKLIQEGFLVARADYSKDNAGNAANNITFWPNNDKSKLGRDAIKDQIKQAKKLRYSQGIIVTQVDVVAHSLGGLMTRSLSQEYGFRSPENYSEGSIHRLITMGTPHNGSPLGPALWNAQFNKVHKQYKRVVHGIETTITVETNDIASILKNNDMPLGDCHPDFDPNSNAFKALERTKNIDVHAIAGSWLNNFLQPAARFSFEAFNKMFLLVTGKTHNQIFLITEDPNNPPFPRGGFTPANSTDCLVPDISQTGGLPLSTVTRFFGTIHAANPAVLIQVHNTETNNPDIINEVIGLLTTQDRKLFWEFFPASSQISKGTSGPMNEIKQATSGKAIQKGQSIQNDLIDSSFIYFPERYRNQTIALNGSDTVKIKLALNSTGDIKFKTGLYLLKDLIIEDIPQQINQEVEFTIPPELLSGKLIVYALLRDSLDRLFMDTCLIKIKSTVQVDSFAVSPDITYLDSSVRESGIDAIGFSVINGSTHTFALSNPSDSLTFETSTTKFKVSNDGRITAVSPGIDSGLVKYRNFSRPFKVEIDSNIIFVTKKPGIIIFEQISDQKYSTTPIVLNAESSNYNTVTYNVVSGPATIEDNLLSMLDTGKVVIKASLPGDAYYESAQDVLQSFTILKGDQRIQFDSIPEQLLSNQPIKLNAIANSFLPITFELVSGPAILNGNLLTPTSSGTIVIRAIQNGNENYLAAAPVERTVHITIVSLEAEDAVLNGAVVASNQPGYTGSGFADYKNASGDFVEWTVNVNASDTGLFLLQFRYANGGAKDRPLKLEVNGVAVVASQAFSPTGKWTSWSVSSANANFIAGINTIRLTTIGFNGPNVDHLKIVQGQPGILEAEDALLNGAVVASNQPGYTGSGFADYLNKSGDFIEWTVNLKPSDSGSCLLRFRYANGGATDRPLKLEVNGVSVVANLAFSPTSSWTTWSVSSATANLIAGTNNIRLTAISSSGPNVDHIELQSVFYHDTDNDGYGNFSDTVHAFKAPAGYVTNNKDCDDTNQKINPEATEVCNGIDDNCDGQIDEGVQSVFYHDADNDGFGSLSDTAHACSAPAGYASNSIDCNDNPENGGTGINPGAAEVCDGIDNNCNGEIDEGFDQDGDGYTTCNSDCDDNNPNVNLGAEDICDGIDNNCNGKIDEDCVCVDQDGDGYTTCDGDCDDNPDINPGVEEICDGIDNNCNGEIDEGVTTTFYLDADRDGYGDDNNIIDGCEAPEGYVEAGGDCDDGNANINPGIEEICDGIDNNCNGETDEGLTSTYYLDADGDGYGDDNNSIEECKAPKGYIETGGDCNDGNANINPGAEEICDGIDNNCSGEADEGLIVTYYLDADGDGYGDDNNTIEDCKAPEGYIETGGDCDDGNADINPGAEEICDGIDNNCNGDMDEGLSATFYLDADGDGYGDDNNIIEDCKAPEGYVETGGDCDDDNADINPGVVENCFDGIDNDCDGGIDDAWWCLADRPSGNVSKSRDSGEKKGDAPMVSKRSSGDVKAGINGSVTLKLVPNPAKDILNIYTTGLQMKQTSISVLSTSGAVVKTKQSSGLTGAPELNISSLPRGVYIIKLLCGDKVMYKQFVKL